MSELSKLTELAEIRKRLDQANEAYAAAAEQERQARLTRDHAIRIAIGSGVTMYAIAKQIGLSEQGVRAIRDKKLTCDVPGCLFADRVHWHEGDEVSTSDPSETTS